MSLPEAARLVQPGDTLALGGMTLYRRPVAFVRELLREGIDGLTILALTCGLEADLLVGAGRVARTRTCYFGLEAFGFAPMFTHAVSAGRVEVIEETEASLTFGLRATLAGVGFMPGQGWIGTDLLAVRPDVKMVTCPYTSRQLVAFPALRPDVVVIHAQECDRSGNAVLIGNLAIDIELAMAAQRVIVTAERIVDVPSKLISVSELYTTAVVETPRGAWPTSCYPEYPLDAAEILRYVETCADGRFGDYLVEFLEGR
jgi:glutaconate CoA-transferase subunit A